ncbi:pseudouridine synthase [Marinobacter zhanjiangensis]|uniref:Pseudouridine synthase n=1 Tax=Marinobacter zhanjiangensis TaxID=578215 RepID=A0ABQ3ANE9_9GAMM|nr:pseudouridine synthase [Marinobacter zhanjiangensis]GGY58520.1 pseudouridine synthase [Marinobacter zhanjiangensis]
MRLDAYLSRCTALSRKDARHAIRAGRVSLDGHPTRKAATIVPDGMVVSLDGLPVILPGHQYLMLNKPAGFLSATTDASHPVVTDLLPQALADRVHPVGRLDLDTTGLLLLTSDGQWSHRITSPRHHCPKTYRVTLADPLSDEARRQLETGLQLRSDDNSTRPATVERQSDRIIDLTITEGRYHQVKRMIAAIGNHVEALHRHRIGTLTLDDSLAPGEFRRLTDPEIRELAPLE